ncbi:MAG: potassium channel family protein [Acidimicrobiales bacterium]
MDRAAPQWRRPGQDPWRRFQASTLLVLSIVIVGWIGYRLLGLPWFDALYQTIITITTVGFTEVDLELANQTSYRLFTLFLVVVGVGAVLYTISVFVDTLIEGSLNDAFRRRRMTNAVAKMNGHTIICGWGQVGHAVADFCFRLGTDVVVIDRDPQEDYSELPLIVGDATNDQVLRAAGVERAHTMVLALDHDADNLFVCLSARAIRRDLFIVARTSDQKNETKFFQAGANRVINPHEIGGSRMAALALQPHVAEFLDEVLHDDQHDVSVQEFVVREHSSMAGHKLMDLRDGDQRSLIIAIRKGNRDYHTNPSPHTVVMQGDVLIALGSNSELDSLRSRI